MLVCLSVFFASTCYGQQPENDSTRINSEKSKHQIAMSLKSPVSDLVVFQLSDIVTIQDADPKTAMNTFQAQPIIPIPLSKNMRIVSRVTATVNHMWETGSNTKYGFGDVSTEFWLSPNYDVDQFGFGAGAIITYPTASNPVFGLQQWVAGPTVAVVKQQGAFTVGLVVNHQWSVGSSVFNTTLIDPWLGYTWHRGFAVEMESQSSYDWTGKDWIIPLQAGVGQLIFVEKLPVNFQLDGVYLLHGPVQPVWGANLTISFVINSIKG